MTEKELDEIRERCDSATAGPWQAWVEGRDQTSGSSFVQTGGDDIEMLGATMADYEFIANAKQDIPRLLAEIERLRSLVGRS